MIGKTVKRKDNREFHTALGDRTCTALICALSPHARRCTPTRSYMNEWAFERRFWRRRSSACGLPSVAVKRRHVCAPATAHKPAPPHPSSTTALPAAKRDLIGEPIKQSEKLIGEPIKAVQPWQLLACDGGDGLMAPEWLQCCLHCRTVPSGCLKSNERLLRCFC